MYQHGKREASHELAVTGPRSAPPQAPRRSVGNSTGTRPGGRWWSVVRVDPSMGPPSSAASAPASSRSEDTTARHGIQQLSESFCASQYAASLKCLDESNYDKSKCQDHFEAYKACRKQERDIRLEANRKSKKFF